MGEEGAINFQGRGTGTTLREPRELQGRRQRETQAEPETTRTYTRSDGWLCEEKDGVTICMSEATIVEER